MSRKLATRSAATGLKQAEIIRAAVGIFLGQHDADSTIKAVIKHRTEGGK